MSTSIYTPYFYIIQHINSGKFYAGVKYAENANPDQLLKFNGYHTSSSYVKNLILDEGLESFTIRKIKVFDTGDQALDYESRFLRRVNAAFNDNFLNRSNNSINGVNIDWGKTKQTTLERYGCESVFQNEEIKEKSKQTMIRNYGVEHNSQLPEIKEKKIQNANNLSNRPTVIEIRKYRDIFKLKLGHDWFWKPQEFLDNLLAELKLTYDIDNPKQITKLEKKKQTSITKYGYENSSQSPEIRAKISNTKINLINRPIVVEIKKYREKFKLNLGNWVCKSQEILDNLLVELKLTYGELE